ncbi:MAG: extracellular solute-binding protein, partial [Lachnospiraceae bacterium]|nr:extracellular solute-binding protein [Lachnospiraceae bacterium]
NADYEGVYHVTPITTNLEEYYTALNAKVDAGQTPDVFIVSPGPNLTTYVAPGVAADLTDYLADGWKDTFSSDAVFAQQTYDGKIYAVPLNIAAACVFYNKDIFKEAGAEVPKTWDDLLAACEKIKELISCTDGLGIVPALFTCIDLSKVYAFSVAEVTSEH